jgi:small subunit ribosomal protein S6
MRNYEIMFILKPGSTDEENDKLIAAMEGVVTSHKGEMIGVEKMGKKKLAYRIDKFDEGYYVLFRLNADGECVKEFERRLRVVDTVIRLYHSESRRGPEAGRQGQGRPPEKGKKEGLPENGRSRPFGDLTPKRKSSPLN